MAVIQMWSTPKVPVTFLDMAKTFLQSFEKIKDMGVKCIHIIVFGRYFTVLTASKYLPDENVETIKVAKTLRYCSGKRAYPRRLMSGVIVIRRNVFANFIQTILCIKYLQCCMTIKRL